MKHHACQCNDHTNELDMVLDSATALTQEVVLQCQRSDTHQNHEVSGHFRLGIRNKNFTLVFEERKLKEVEGDN